MKSISRRTLSEEVYAALKTAILTNQYPPGAVLNEIELAKSLDVSPTPIREAFHKLRGDGLVEYQPWKGTRIVEFSDEDIEALFDVRLVLENLALRHSVEKLTEDDKSELQQILSRFPKTDNPEHHLEYDRLFHGFFRQRSNSPWVVRTLDNLYDILYLIRYHSSATAASNRATEREHKAIAQAAIRGDVEAAIAAMTDHMRRVSSDIIEQRESSKRPANTPKS